MPHRTSTEFIYNMDIFKLLSKAATLTPDYPAHLRCERKIKFLQQIVMVSVVSRPVHRGTRTFGV